MSFDARLLTGVGVMAAVVESGSFAGAGDALGLTPSGVSRAVARLEAKVGVRRWLRCGPGCRRRRRRPAEPRRPCGGD
jgi:DNA-binding transcriptional LysR family regulator